MTLVNEFAKEIARNGLTLIGRLLAPHHKAINTTLKRLDFTALPVGTIIEYGRRKARLQKFIGGDFSGAIGGVPLAPIGIATGSQLIALNHLLSGVTKRAQHTAGVATGSEVIVEVVGYTLLIVLILQDGFGVTLCFGLRPRIGIFICQFKATLVNNCLGSLGGLIPALGIEHSPRLESQRSPLGQAASCTRLWQVVGSIVEVILHKVPTSLLGREGLVGGNLLHIVVVNNNLLVAFHQLKVDKTTEESHLCRQTDKVGFREIRLILV